MNEETNTASVESSVGADTGIEAETGSVTPEEVLSVLGKAPVETQSEETEMEPEAAEDEPTEEQQEGTEAEPTAELTKEQTEATTEVETQEQESRSFAIEVEDANGNKITVNPDDRLEDVLKDFEPKNNGQIFQILDDVHEARAQKAAWDRQQAEATQEADFNKKVSEMQAVWAGEIKQAQADKRIPVTGDGKQSERVDQVFKFMTEENAKRIEAGRPPIQSFEDALDKLEVREAKDQKAEAARLAKEEARKKGGLVGGSSAPSTSSAPVYKGGARNASDALRSMGMLS